MSLPEALKASVLSRFLTASRDRPLFDAFDQQLHQIWRVKPLPRIGCDVWQSRFQITGIVPGPNCHDMAGFRALPTDEERRRQDSRFCPESAAVMASSIWITQGAAELGFLGAASFRTSPRPPTRPDRLCKTLAWTGSTQTFWPSKTPGPSPQVILQSATNGILAEIATFSDATAPVWLGNIIWNLLAGTNQICNLHATDPLSIALATTTEL